MFSEKLKEETMYVLRYYLFELIIVSIIELALLVDDHNLYYLTGVRRFSEKTDLTV